MHKVLWQEEQLKEMHEHQQQLSQDQQLRKQEKSCHSAMKGTWCIVCKQLKQHKEVHGNCSVPQKCEADPKLGNWVKVQRQSEKTMSSDKKQLLINVDFVWCLVKKSKHELWD